MLKGTFYLYYTWTLKLKTRTDLFYMTEFCWVACHIYLTFLWCALYAIKWEWFRNITYNRTAFYGYWGIANGAFGFSAIAFKNALVFHDLPEFCSAFIHLTPVSLSWTLRWYANDVSKMFPGVFDLPDPTMPVT